MIIKNGFVRTTMDEWINLAVVHSFCIRRQATGVYYIIARTIAGEVVVSINSSTEADAIDELDIAMGLKI